MAYRRKQGGISRSATFKEEKNLPPDDGEWAATSSLASHPKGGSGPGPTYDYTSMGSSNETGSFWGVLARKAKAILEDDNMQQSDSLLTQARSDYFNSPRANANLQGGGGVPLNVKRQESGNKIEIVRKGVNEGRQEVKAYGGGREQSPLRKPMQLKSKTHEDQLKASRDVRWPWQLQPKQNCFSES